MDTQFFAPPNFSPVFGYSQGQASSIPYLEGQYLGHPGYHGTPSYLCSFQRPRNACNAFIGEHASLVDGKTESKPRLTKEEVDTLEKEFRKNPKPSSAVKAQLAERLGLERARINVGLLDTFSPTVLLTSSAELVPEPTGQGKTGEEARRIRGSEGSRAGPLRISFSGVFFERLYRAL